MNQYSLKRNLLFIVIGFTVISQVLYLYFNIQSFQNSYDQVVRSNIEIAGNTLKSNLEYILKKGIPIKTLFGLQNLLKGILDDAPYLAAISVTEAHQKVLYYCDRKAYLQGENLAKQGKTVVPNDEANMQFPLANADAITVGYLVLTMDQTLISERVRGIVIDTGTIILISILSVFDFLLFFVVYTIALPVRMVTSEIDLDLNEGVLDRPADRTGIDFVDDVVDYFDAYRIYLKEKWIRIVSVAHSFMESTVNACTPPPPSALIDRFENTLGRMRLNSQLRSISVADPVLIRPALFLFVFAESLSISFLPLYAKELYTPFFNLSEAVVLGLPISAFMLSTALSLPLGGALSDIIGRRKAFLTAAVISSIGLAFTGTAQTITMLIVYRAIVGIGFGMVYMTVQGYIVDTTKDGSRAEGMAIFLSAFYGGTLCGSAIGGMIADRTGFRALFFGGSVLTMISVYFLYRYISSGIKSTPVTHTPKASEQWLKRTLAALPSFKDLIRLLRDRNFIAISVFQAIPNKVCLIGFVYYLAPLFLRQLGNSQSDTGRFIMGYSLVMILFSQALSKWADRHGNIKMIICVGGVLSGLLFIPFIIFQNTPMVACGILLLGVVHAFSISTQAKFASQLQVVHDVGYGSGLGLYRQVERCGNVVAPILLGVLVSAFDYAYALAIIGAYTILSSFLFLLFCKEPERGVHSPQRQAVPDSK